jgi:hypothetical protein
MKLRTFEGEPVRGEMTTDLPVSQDGLPVLLVNDEPFFPEEASLTPPGEDLETRLKCRRRPSTKPCPGKILAIRGTDENPILWKCTYCGTGGQISKWRGTQWDNSMGTVH